MCECLQPYHGGGLVHEVPLEEPHTQHQVVRATDHPHHSHTQRDAGKAGTHARSERAPCPEGGVAWWCWLLWRSLCMYVSTYRWKGVSAELETT